MHGQDPIVIHQDLKPANVMASRWCLAHRLKLAIKDALKGSSFDDVDEMLLRLYYLYQKSPKKCHQLEEIIVQVRGCILDDSTACKGKKPIRASGTRWIAHKLGAMKRILSQYGVGCTQTILPHSLKITQ